VPPPPPAAIQSEDGSVGDELEDAISGDEGDDAVPPPPPAAIQSEDGSVGDELEDAISGDEGDDAVPPPPPAAIQSEDGSASFIFNDGSSVLSAEFAATEEDGLRLDVIPRVPDRLVPAINAFINRHITYEVMLRTSNNYYCSRGAQEAEDVEQIASSDTETVTELNSLKHCWNVVMSHDSEDASLSGPPVAVLKESLPNIFTASSGTVCAL
jgi:hypothetical protein